MNVVLCCLMNLYITGWNFSKSRPKQTMGNLAVQLCTIKGREIITVRVTTEKEKKKKPSLLP